MVFWKSGITGYEITSIAVQTYYKNQTNTTDLPAAAKHRLIHSQYLHVLPAAVMDGCHWILEFG
jgi:hypothetical protein